MQTVQPHTLTNEELLRHVYMLGNENLPKEWVEALCQRFAQLLDEPQFNKEEVYNEGFEEGFEAGIEHAQDDFK